MTKKDDTNGAGPLERAQNAGVDGPAVERRGRMSAKRKQSAVLRLLRGEDLELLSRELGVTAADLSSWRDGFLAAGEASLKSRPADGRDDVGPDIRTRALFSYAAGSIVMSIFA